MKRTILVLSAAVAVVAFWTTSSKGGVQGLTFIPTGFLSVGFNDPHTVAKAYDQARDNFCDISSRDLATGKVRPLPDILSPNEEQFWNSSDWYSYQQEFDGGQTMVNFYPMSGYNHIHLGWSDPNFVQVSPAHIFPDDRGGGGCFCNNHDGTIDANGNQIRGFGFTHLYSIPPSAFFPGFSEWICEWQGLFNPDGSFREAPCPDWTQGRGGINGHDGHAWVLSYMSTGILQPDGSHKSDGVRKPFSLQSVTTGPGGDLEIWTVDFDTGDISFIGPLAPNQTFTFNTKPLRHLFFHDFNNGIDGAGTDGGRAVVNQILYAEGIQL